MQTITKFLVLFILCLFTQFVSAQEKATSKHGTEIINQNKAEIQKLIADKKLIIVNEKNQLKAEVEAVNSRLVNNEITSVEAEQIKIKLAEKRALNIENRIAIIDNKIELLKRNDIKYKGANDEESGSIIRIGTGDDTNDSFIFIGKKVNDKPRKEDLRTKSDMVFAFGFNNAIVDGENLEDSPYKFAGSRFFELGWAWKTRVLKESNFIRFKYGFSFQINGLKPQDNNYFVDNNGVTSLEEFPTELRKSKLSITNLVLPIHFEFGPSKKIKKNTYFRYSTRNKFKIGVGGYAGFNIGTRQKLKYSIDGEKVKDKIKRDYNTTGLVYGLSGYLAFDDIAVYVKYDISPIFKDQTIAQNNISLGLRFDMD